MTPAESVYVTGRYLEENPSWHAEDAPWKAAHIISFLQDHALIPHTVAEVGCGSGEILKQLYTYLPDTTLFFGYDISPQAITLASQRSRPRLQFHLDDLVAVENTFDLLLAVDVFEHVEDYLGFLRELRGKAQHTVFHIPLDLSAQTVLRKSALLRTREEVGHLHYFTEETALASLTDAGYEIIDYRLTARSIDRPGGHLRSRLAVLPRRLLAAFSPSLASRVLGGFSLLVLTRPAFSPEPA